jgi:hypothetical protein
LFTFNLTYYTIIVRWFSFGEHIGKFCFFVQYNFFIKMFWPCTFILITDGILIFTGDIVVVLGVLLSMFCNAWDQLQGHRHAREVLYTELIPSTTFFLSSPF